jgi:hypothetical protein
MTSKHELKGALFFSDKEPQITGYLVIAGIEYEIAGWHASVIRADITARKRGERKDDEPEQVDIFGGARDATSGHGDG